MSKAKKMLSTRKYPVNLNGYTRRILKNEKTNQYKFNKNYNSFLDGAGKFSAYLYIYDS